jgi:hypothetical protein
MVDEHELLVHISTPATRQNDDLYRSLAGAYLEFEPYQSHAEDSQKHDVSSQLATSPLNDRTVPNKGSSFTGSINTSILSTSKDSYGSFPSHLSSDGTPKGYAISPYDGVAEDDFAPTSSRLARLERLHQNWKAQATPKSSSASKQWSTKDGPSSPEDADTAFIEDTQTAVQALQSQLQDSFSMVYEDTSEDESDAGDATQESPLSPVEPAERTTVTAAEKSVPPRTKASAEVLTADVNHHESTPLEEASPAKVRVLVSSSPHSEPSSVVPEQQEALRANDATKPSSSIAQHNTSDNNSVDETDKVEQVVDFTDFPEMVVSPKPNISIESPETWPSQMTDYLAAIKTQNPTRFNPMKKLRDPVYNERGYWAVECSTWPAQLQKELWNRVCEPLLDGRLGWATMLYRKSDSSKTLGTVQLFSWGELAEHMWLLLWLCSNGRTSGAGLKWVACGDAIFEME